MHIPGFILDFIFSSPWLAGGYVILHLGELFVGLPSSYVLPLLLLDHRTARASIRASWQMTSQRQWWSLLKQIILLSLLLGVLLLLVVIIVVLTQIGWDHLAQPKALYFATLNLTLLEVSHSLLGTWFATVTLALAAAPVTLPSHGFSFTSQRAEN